jgi:hypothetical protein
MGEYDASKGPTRSNRNEEVDKKVACPLYIPSLGSTKSFQFGIPVLRIPHDPIRTQRR